MSRFVANARPRIGATSAGRFGDLNRASVVSGFTRARRRRQRTFNPRPGSPWAPSMKNLTPYLITAAVCTLVVALIFRAAPAGIRKVIVGA
jgi:hypothetical protein